MSKRNVKIEFTRRELMAVFECLETMKGMVGAMDEEFNAECLNGNNSFHKALKRSGFKIEIPKYNNSNINLKDW